MAVYHIDVFWPNQIKLPKGFVGPTYSQHAKRAASDDRYGVFQLPAVFDMDKAKPVEYNTEENKLVFRYPFSTKYDLVVVMLLGANFVKTVWLNEKSDNHKTLRRGVYAKN